MRERGSSTARPMEKGVGGLPIWRAGRADCADFVAIWRAGRAGRVETRGANTKKARFLNRGIGFSYRKASRALNLL